MTRLQMNGILIKLLRSWHSSWRRVIEIWNDDHIWYVERYAWYGGGSSHAPTSDSHVSHSVSRYMYILYEHLSRCPSHTTPVLSQDEIPFEQRASHYYCDRNGDHCLHMVPCICYYTRIRIVPRKLHASGPRRRTLLAQVAQP
jgi:hypothetical protein